MTAAEDVTLAEVIRRLASIERKMDERAFVSSDVYHAEKSAAIEARRRLEERVEKLEDAQTWATRAIAGAFLMILIEGAMLAQGLGS